MKKLDYLYNAKITSVYDGDTVTADVDLGMKVWVKGVKLRLYGIDTPELRGDEREAGIVSRDALRAKILHKEVVIHSLGRGKYGRWLAVVWVDDDNVNLSMIAEGLAKPYPS